MKDLKKGIIEDAEVNFMKEGISTLIEMVDNRIENPTKEERDYFVMDKYEWLWNHATKHSEDEYDKLKERMEGKTIIKYPYCMFDECYYDTYVRKSVNNTDCYYQLNPPAREIDFSFGRTSKYNNLSLQFNSDMTKVQSSRLDRYFPMEICGRVIEVEQQPTQGTTKTFKTVVE